MTAPGSPLALASGGVWDAGDDYSWGLASDGVWILPSGYFVKLHCTAIGQTADGYSVTLTVEAAGRVAKELFVFQRKPNTELGAYDEFSHIASPSDLEAYPVGRTVGYAPFYRLAAVTLVFRRLDLLMQSLRDMKRDICLLVETAEQMDVLSECQFVVDKDGASACLPV